MKQIKRSNKLIIKILISIILSFISLTTFSQDFDLLQNPLSVKWRQIKAGDFRLIYPVDFEKEAQRMANTFPQIYPQLGKNIGQQKTSISILFQNQGTLANGFVQLAPRKSEFYTTPPQQFDSQDWLNNLAVHELRHVAQFDKIIGKSTLPLFDEIYAAYLSMSIPDWLFEGDAVSTETSLTNAGRGRQPSWIMPFRTALLEGKHFSYSKAYFGSSKDQTPGFYQLGYLLTSELHTKYGENIVNRLLSDIHDRPFRLYPFSNSLRKITGKSSRQWYLQSENKIRRAWQAQDSLTSSEIYLPLNRPPKAVSHYFFPSAINKEEILALKYSKSDVPAFILINKAQKEKHLFSIGYQEQPWFSYANDLLVWDEIRYDPRYKHRNYSVICIYDFKSGKRKQLTFGSRLFSPSLSADGKKLVAIEVDKSNQTQIVSIDLESGKIKQTYANPKNEMLQSPALNADGSQLSWISVNEKGKSLWLMDRNGKSNKLIAESIQQLGRVVFIGEKITFNAHLSGIDNIYEIDPSNKEIVALSAAKYGAFNASLTKGGDSILFNNYSLNGYDIAKKPLTRRAVPSNNFVYFGLSPDESFTPIFDSIPQQSYTSSKYKPLSHALNFHSLSPYINDDGQAGLQLKSSDLLNTTDIFAGASYNSDLRSLAYHAGLTYKALYPVLSLTYDNRPEMSYYKTGNMLHPAHWRENQINAKIILPLSFSSFQHSYSFRADLGTSYTQRTLNDQEAMTITKQIRFPMNYQLTFRHSLRSAERDLAPRFAQAFSFRYFNLPFEPHYQGHLFAFLSNFNFPGFAKNHVFTAGFNYQQATGVLRSSTEINTVYGYSQIIAKTELQNTLLLSYRFPLAYPDAEISSLAYIRNIRAGFFSHYENIGIETNLTEPKTFGLEIRSSVNLLRYQPVVDLGTRIIFVNKIYHQKPILAFIFNYSF